MRVEKKNLTQEYIGRLNSSPFFIVVDYQGLRVGPLTELRRRLVKAGAEIHVVKNSVFRVAAREAGVATLEGTLTGQLAVVTGRKDIAATAKVLKSFRAEFERPQVRFGYLGQQRLEQQQVTALAELPGVEVLRGRLLGLLGGPATNLVRLLKAPSGRLVRVLQARVEKGEG